MLVDVFITTFNRPKQLKETLFSLFQNTNVPCRITVVQDLCDRESSETIHNLMLTNHVNHHIISAKNEGLGPSVNKAISFIDTLNKWELDHRVGNKDLVSEFICYCQDDVRFSKGWLETLIKFFLMFEKQYNIGFASGHNAIEHKTKAELVPGKVLLKDWIRATNVFGRREYWNSLHPIPKFDPETGRTRAKPNDGIGSSVDWWWIRNAENSVCKKGKTCLVVPGLVQHAGFQESTWLDRPLPESKEDLEKINDIT